MAWIKLKDLFATKKEFNAEKDKNSKEIAGLRDSIFHQSRLVTKSGVNNISFDWADDGSGLMLYIYIDSTKVASITPTFPK